MKKFIPLITLTFLLSVVFAQEKMIIRIVQPTKSDYNFFHKKGYDIAFYKPKTILDLVVTSTDLNELNVSGYSYNIIQTEKEAKQNLIVGKSLNGYRTYEDLLSELQTIAANNPTICELSDIGDSRGKEYMDGGNNNYTNYNHEIWLLKLSDNVAIEEDEPSIFYLAEHHAREPISLEVNLYILNHLISNYGSNPDITYYIDNTEIWFVPLVNPNGHRIVTDEDDLWWRKNIRDNNENNQLDLGSSPDGVDPNRNYGWQWGGQGTSNDIYDDLYHGPYAFSEPEIQSIKSLIESHHFVAGLTYHSYGELILYPYGYSENTVAPDQVALSDLATSVATAIPATGGGHYTPEAAWELYAASGVTNDWMYGENGIFSFTVELATTFIPPADDILGICQDNLQASLILLDRVNESTLTGHIFDANTSQPVVAEIFIDGIDNTGVYRKPYKSDIDFGRYYRLLVDGNYTVTFSAYGYIPQTFTNVNINNLDQTLLDVYLLPAVSVDITGVITDLNTGLPIELATLEILGTPLSAVQTNSSGVYSILNVAEGTYDIRVSALDYSTIIESKIISASSFVFDFQLQESVAWSFESGAFEPQWLQGGDAPWIVTTENAYDGAYCSKSGSISDEQTSEMEISLVLSSGGDVSFFRKVSSEASYDYLRFYIDGSLQNSWAGELDWAEVSFPVTVGEHTFKWEYYKDQSVSNGSDCAWVDYIIFPPYVPLPEPADIELSQMNFEVSLSPDNMTTEQLVISNIGDMNLTYDITKLYQTESIKAYCSSVGGNNDEFIQNVSIGSINNTTAQSDYADYTNSSTTVEPDLSYPITVTNGNPSWETDQCGIWVDWNQNEDFTDDGVISVSGSPGVGPYTASIVPPGDALAGPTRMRIQIIYNQSPNPCLASFSYGEVEDYTIYVNSSTTNWLTISPMNGSILGQDDQNIDFTFNSTDLEEGDYFADVEIASNDTDEPSLIVPCTLHVVSGFFLDLSAQLQGPFNGSQMNTLLNSKGILPLNQPYENSPWNYPGLESVPSIPNSNVVDWVLIELRETSGDASTALPSTILARQAGFLLNNGNIVAIDGLTPLRFDQSITQNLFVVINHRNHLSVISTNSLVKIGDTYSFDFSTIGQSFGSDSQIEIAPGLWGMVSGDDNHDGSILGNDFIGTWNSSAGNTGILDHDLNLDSQINNIDKNDYWLPNLGYGTGVPQ